MSAASSDLTSNTIAPPSRMDASYHKCISCGKRYWQKNVLVRRSAKCKGVRYRPDGSRWVCRAWRCRFNDQCTGADAACPICGTFKPPEFLPDQPVSASNPAQSSRSASSADPSLVPTNQPPDRYCTVLPAMCPYGQPDSSSLRAMNPNGQCIVPRGTITHLPCYEGVSQRFLIEV